MPRPSETGNGKLPGFLADAALDQAQHGLRPGLINIVFNAVRRRSSTYDSEELG